MQEQPRDANVAARPTQVLSCVPWEVPPYPSQHIAWSSEQCPAGQLWLCRHRLGEERLGLVWREVVLSVSGSSHLW